MIDRVHCRCYSYLSRSLFYESSRVCSTCRHSIEELALTSDRDRRRLRSRGRHALQLITNLFYKLNKSFISTGIIEL